MKRLALSCIIIWLPFAVVFSQSKPQVLPEVEDFLTKEKYDDVDKLVKQRIPLFIRNKNIDTLGYYVTYLGKAADNLRGPAKAKEELTVFLKQVQTTFPYNKAFIGITIKAAHHISTSGDHKSAYEIVENLNKYFSGRTEGVKTELPRIYFALGDFAVRMGNPALATEHYKRSMELLKQIPNPDKEQLVIANNSMGIIMHFASKADSAAYYWKKALDIANQMDTTVPSVYYRKASIENNLSNAYSYLGKQKDAIKMLESAVRNYKAFITSKEPNPLKTQAEIYQLYSTDNIGKIYLDLGDLTKAYNIYYYSYESKLKKFDEKNLEIHKAKVYLATVCNNQHKYKQAKKYALEALEGLRKNGDTANSWDAGANTQAAIAYRNLKQTELAASYYREADRLNKKAVGENYNEFYFGFLDGLVLFYSENNNSDKAIDIARNAVTQAVKMQGENAPLTVRKLQSLARAQYAAKDFNAVLKTSERALKASEKLLSNTHEVMDSVSLEIEKAKLILWKSKAKYNLLAKNDTAAIQSILQELAEASNIVEHRKTILAEQTDINLLLSENKELTDFIKHLNYELFKLSDNNEYIDKIIGIHETTLYTRIRSRMDRQKAIRFANLPDSIQLQEMSLKERMQAALHGASTTDDKVLIYLQAVKEWQEFQQQLKAQYPRYYNMRYAAADLSLKEISNLIPNDMTIIRYIFSNQQLFALVATKQKQTLVPLSSAGLSDKIVMLNEALNDASQAGKLSFELYQQLWQPIEKEIKHKRVIVIPDDVLYNVSFEMLTPVATHNFTDLSKKCLLNTYAISYQYSLLALQAEKKQATMKGNFIAFAPGFSEKDKQQYRLFAKTDSLNLDKTYLSLLPLPFTIKLAQKIQEKLGGSIFTQAASTPEAFRRQAGNHHIIHIGTHAESNNDYPEYSRLIFAKDDKKMSGENSVYLYDIYNCNLVSDLAVLTACESGKPGYQDGEGMISMAHAFNYAGSESIMTGLWKIDEQSSTLITEAFYEYLQEGMSKDEALRLSKIKYLQNAPGRMLAPQYWAGLVIMGDVSPVTLSSGFPKLVYWIGAGCLLFVTLLIWHRNSKSTA